MQAPALLDLTAFSGAIEDFLRGFLAFQCKHGNAESAALVRLAGEDRVEVVGLVPAGPEQPAWLQAACALAVKRTAWDEPLVKGLAAPDDLYGADPTRHVMLFAAPALGERVVFVAYLNCRDRADLDRRRDRLQVGLVLLNLYEARARLGQRQTDVDRLRAALEVFATLNGHARFVGAAMTLCNEIAARWKCDRVTLGFLYGRYVKAVAMSHTEKFSRKMEAVGAIEKVMEECLDQDEEILAPPSEGASGVCREAKALAARAGQNTVLSLPIRAEARPVAVLTLERTAAQPFGEPEIASLRLLIELAAPLLVRLHEADRFVAIRMARGVRRACAWVLGAQHTGYKLAALAVVGVAAFLTLGQGTHRATASFVLQADVQRVVPAPFDAHLAKVEVEPGDRVEAGKTVLATLDVANLELERAEARAEVVTHQKKAALEMRDNRMAQVQIAEAEARQAEARVKLLDSQIAKAQLIAPIDGIVVVGDLKRQIGAPFKKGDVLFKVAALDHLHAEVYVTDDEIAETREGQTGEIAAAAFPDRPVGFTVGRINPVAEVVDQKNVFQVRGVLARHEPWMRPGMEGVATIDLGRRSWGYIYSRPILNWLRMELWL